MIAVDTSALMAVLLGEPEGDACTEFLEGDEDYFCLPALWQRLSELRVEGMSVRKWSA